MFPSLARLAGLFVACFGLLPSLSRAADPFTHTVTAENQTVDATVLDHPSLNGRPDWRVFITQRFVDYNPREVGVAYDATRARWLIQNDDMSRPAVGLQFNVVSFPPGPPQIIRHTSTIENTKEYYTLIRHPASDFNSEALLLVTPDNTVGTRSAGPLGVWYDGKQWSIYRQDKEPMETGIRFNVFVSAVVSATAAESSPLGLGRAHLHRSDPVNTRGYYTITDLRDAGAFPFITHNYRDSGPYNFHVTGVWFNSTDWVILNQDNGDIAPGSMFNVFVFTPGLPFPAAAVPAQPAVTPAVVEPPVAPALGWIELGNAENVPVIFTLSYVLDGKNIIFITGALAPEDSRRYEIPSRARELRIKAESEGDDRRMLLDRSFAKTPNQKITTREKPPL